MKNFLDNYGIYIIPGLIMLMLWYVAIYQILKCLLS